MGWQLDCLHSDATKHSSEHASNFSSWLLSVAHHALYPQKMLPSARVKPVAHILTGKAANVLSMTGRAKANTRNTPPTHNATKPTCGEHHHQSRWILWRRLLPEKDKIRAWRA